MNEFDLYSIYVKDGSIAYDIGAHIGEISFQMKKKLEIYFILLI